MLYSEVLWIFENTSVVLFWFRLSIKLPIPITLRVVRLAGGSVTTVEVLVPQVGIGLEIDDLLS